MGRTAKVAVSIDAALLRRVEELRSRTGETRSAVVARAIQLLTGEEERARRSRDYLRAYREHPESAAEVDLADDIALHSLRSLDWSDE